MATYRALKGFEIQVQSSDPSDPPKGQVWYNTTAGTLKMAGAGAWASGTTLPSPASRYSIAGFGIATAGAIVGGYGGSPTNNNETNEYDGTSWASGGNMVAQASNTGSSGTQTAAFTAGGYGPSSEVATSATYNGSSWTAVGSIVDGARELGSNQSAGTETAGMIYGSAAAGNTSHETFDGASWSAATDMNIARGQSGGMGTQTAAIVCGGGSPDTSAKDTTEEWNGSAWTAGGTMNTARNRCSGGPGGSAYTSAWLGGGRSAPPALVGNTESYDGSTWIVEAAMATGRTFYGSFGTKTSGVVCGGSPGPTLMQAVEEFTVPGVTTITTST